MGMFNLVLATSLVHSRTRPIVASADVFGLGECRQQLLEALRIQDKNPAKTEEIIALHAESIVPLEERIFLPDVPLDERKEMVVAVARSLDFIEEAVSGPMLAGSRCTAADASLFPSIALFEQTLVPHFGWTPWTDEAMFYRRPRLHAWRELMQYEQAAVQVEEQLANKLKALNWDDLAVEVPTSRLRKFPSHTSG
mgnify:CR=1 FL=1